MSTTTRDVMVSPKIRVLEHGKKTWDVILDVVNSGVTDNSFFDMDVDDLIRKHKEWKLKMPLVTPFYSKGLL